MHKENKFDEQEFIVALINRPEACKIALQNFNPEFLYTSNLIPVLNTIYDFVKKHKVPPSLPTLHIIFKDKNEQLYENIYKSILKQLESINIDQTRMTYILDKAKNVAMSRSIVELFNSSQFRNSNENNDGEFQIREIEKWMRKFNMSISDVGMNFKDAYTKLIEDRRMQITETTRIMSHLSFLDDWTDGGMRTKNLGIFVAPTGEGKSLFLMELAYRIAKIEGRKVLFITNELSINEQTERFVACIAAKHIKDVIEDPTIARNELERHWVELEKNLIIHETTSGTSDNIEAILAKEYNLSGFKPDAVIIDYMERMQPNQTGFDPSATWTKYGAIAKDLNTMGKKWDCLIWTAAQTNRTAYRSEKNQEVSLYLSSVQGSVQHLQEAACVIGWIKIPDYKGVTDGNTLVRVQCLKNRHGKNEGQYRYIEIKFSHMHITNIEHATIDMEQIEEKKDNKTFKNSIKEVAIQRVLEAERKLQENDRWEYPHGSTLERDKK